ncbi:ATP-grasp domain-containing protein [Paenibacillus sp. FSL R5-0341]|uniref:ATP-grasp domain-containing protein n=1 Tax=Paenibacillus sp. FSL R5-0341 TaxID=2921636 RepID=UPI0030D45083
MKIIFSSSPLDEKKVDESYEQEYVCAKELGFEVGLVHLEELIVNKRPELAVRRLKHATEREDVLYRGWMLTPEAYGLLYKALASKNLYLINTPEQYKHCHYLPESYDVIKGYTPHSVWVPMSVIQASPDAVKEATRQFGNRPIIVKDYVKSRKHEWKEACYIPDAADEEHVKQVVHNFVRLQGEELNVGLVFREYVQLEFLSYHDQSGMPLSREMRVFMLDGKPAYISNYWDEGQDEAFRDALTSFLDIAQTIQSRFYTMDFAKVEGGSWIVLELGDGQVAGLPDYADPLTFYEQLKIALV